MTRTASKELGLVNTESLVGNSMWLSIFWVVLSGFWLFLMYLVAGVIQCITVIGIPFGKQSFKLAFFAFYPFGGLTDPDMPGVPATVSVVGKVVWFVLSGLWLAIGHAVLGVLLCITIIGIPFGYANFKMIPLALTPFGKDIVSDGSV